jgi:hypothetical protein
MNVSSRRPPGPGWAGEDVTLIQRFSLVMAVAALGACDRLHFAAFTAEESDRSEVDPAMELATEAVPRGAQASGGVSAVPEQ